MTIGADPRFRSEGDVLVPVARAAPPDYDYNEAAFEDMLAMQRDHFWYRGRHRFLLKVFDTEVRRRLADRQDLRAIDLGGGCGGWVEYLHTQRPDRFSELALGDGSLRALTLAGPVVGAYAARYQIDLLDLAWDADWDAVFLLDVLEHIPDHIGALRQIRNSLRPGGLLFVAVPALKFFWSYNDVLAGHQRRYAKDDFAELAAATDMTLLRADYFMFFLSPALFISRTLFRPDKASTSAALEAHRRNAHRIPPAPVNAFAAGIFSAEASLANAMSFPWGTSVLAVLQRPR